MIRPADRIRRRLDLAHRLKRPMLLCNQRPCLRPDRSGLYPGGEIRDYRIGQRLVRRHLDLGVRAANRLDQQAFVGISRYQCRTMLSTLQERFSRVDPEAVADFLAAVALQARVGQHRTNFCLEQCFRVVSPACRRGCEPEQC